LLRKVLYRHVPRELVDRPKQGFGIPLTEWLQGSLSHLIDHHLAPDIVRSGGLLDEAIVRRLVAQFRGGHTKLVNKIWVLLAFQLWREKWA
jgi:asparagine synthase (glutamine-hydrolysing)